MRVRWGRGFFRLWVLIAAVWIGASTWIVTRTHEPAVTATKLPPGFVLDPPSAQSQISFDNLLPRDRAECERAAQREPRVDVAACTRAAWLRMLPAPEAVAWVILPPLILLLVGAAMAWAARGFKAETSC